MKALMHSVFSFPLLVWFLRKSIFGVSNEVRNACESCDSIKRSFVVADVGREEKLETAATRQGGGGVGFSGCLMK